MTGVARWWVLGKVTAIVVGSFLAADAADAVIAASFRDPEAGPAVTGRAMPAPVTRRSLEQVLSPIVSRNVFLHGEPVPGEEIAAVEALEEGPSEGCTLPVQVLASVFVPLKPSLSLVTLQDPSKKVYVAQVGELVADQATLVEVHEEWDDESLRKNSIAVFRREDGTRVVCRSDETAQAAPVAIARGGKPSRVQTGEGIKKISSNEFEIPQEELDAVMNGGLASIATTVRIVPYFEGGKSAGFKLYSIKRGSLLSKIGLRSGDILRKVNGYDISSPEKALEVYGILKHERNVSVDITRGGKNQSLSYSIR